MQSVLLPVRVIHSLCRNACAQNDMYILQCTKVSLWYIVPNKTEIEFKKEHNQVKLKL